MSMELISREDALREADYLILETSYDNEKVEEMLKELPTVKAIPIEKLEQIISEIQSLRGCSCSCSDGIIDDVEDIIDKAIKEIANGKH